MLCLIFSLAGLEIDRGGDKLEVVFLLDLSDSMPADAQTKAIEYIETALANMGPDDSAALVVFARDALVERHMSSFDVLSPITSILDTDQTDLREAMRLALGLYSPDAAHRMVILSDGAITSDDVTSTAQVVAGSGVEILALPFDHQLEKEIMLRDVAIPTSVGTGERFDISVNMLATDPVDAELHIYAGGELVARREVELTRGLQTFRVPMVAGNPGFTRYVVQLIAEEDTFYQNNELATFVEVLGPPRVLVVAPLEGEPIGFSNELRPDEVTALRRALEGGEFLIEVIKPVQVPFGDPSELANYASVILVDVPARDLNLRQMRALQTYVRDLGGGLIVVGGPTSFGVGGYYRTPLEETLPVEMRIKDQLRHPPLAIVFVIDYSGSMADTSGGVSKLDMAKEAVIRSVELLFPGDRVGVVAFDSAASWIVGMTEASDLDLVIEAVGSLRPGGGTDIFAGLEAMAKVLPSESVKDKHVILLTDGGADPSGIPELVSRLYNEEGITLTTVGVGRDAAHYLPELAMLGRGRYHFASDPASIPSIFTEETALASRSYIVEETFYPTQRYPSDILMGIHEVPQLHGYVATSIKGVASMILASHEGDPILAVWQYGLGRAVAFTSDATGRWANDWVQWSSFPAFWRQTVRFAAGQPDATPLGISVETDIDSVRLVVDAVTEAGEYMNMYAFEVRVVSPEGDAENIPLSQVAPGRYVGEFTPEEQGSYLFHVTGRGDGRTLSTTKGWVLTYSPEYRPPMSRPEALEELAVDAGGRLAPSNSAHVFDHTLDTPHSTQPLWPWLLMFAASLLPIDVAIRRLAIDRSVLRQPWRRLTNSLRQRRALIPERLAKDFRMKALIQAKRRVREMQETVDQEVEDAIEPARFNDTIAPSDSMSQRSPLIEYEHTTDEGTTAAKLLAKKKARRGRDEEDTI
jgi:Mg-chelatase subunit ChlD